MTYNSGEQRQEEAEETLTQYPSSGCISQTQEHQKARDLKYQVQEDLEKCFVDWDELPEAEQEDILEREIRLAEEAIKKAELKKYLDTLPTMDPDPDQPQASSSTLPATATHVEMTKEEVRQAIGALSQLMHDLTDRVMHLTNQVTILAAATPPAAAAAAATGAAVPPICPKSKDNVKRPESWKGKGSSADSRYFLAANVPTPPCSVQEWTSVHRLVGCEAVVSGVQASAGR